MATEATSPHDRKTFPTAAAAAAGVALLAAVLAAGCVKPTAYGKANSLILVTPGDSLWAEVEDTTYAALEPTLFTIRREKKFYVQRVDTASVEDFRKLRPFQRVLVFGTPDNRFVRQVAEAAGAGEPQPGRFYDADDIWARGQTVTAVVLDPDAPAASWRSALADLARRVEEEYRLDVRRRMFTTGVDSAAADSLQERFGFRVTFPRVYDVRIADDGRGPVIIRNDNPEPSQLIRSLLVDWRSPPLDTLTAEAAYEWRAAVDSVHYNIPQAIDTTRRGRSERVRRLEVSGRPALEARGAWSDEGSDFPAGGPFVVRLVQCPDRTYFLDAWLYAPGKDKYQYMIQLRQLLDGFSCGTAPARARGPERAGTRAPAD